MNKEEFIGKAIVHMAKHGISINLINDKKVDADGIKTSGFFSEKEFFCALKPKDWLETFVHEYCHFLQSIDKEYKTYPDEVWEDFDLWILKKKELPKKKAKEYADIIRSDEIDCEKRTVDLIKKYKLPINIKEYVQSANSYALFYTLAWKYRSWYINKGPYDVEELIEMMPTEFLQNWDDVPRKYEEIVCRQCFNLI